MDGRRLGAAFRAVRTRGRSSQRSVAAAARISQSAYSRIERGHVDNVPIGRIERVAAVLDVRVDLVPRWRGGDLARLLDAGHAALVEEVMRRLAQHAGWESVPEVTFSIYGERGSVDIVAWHAASRTLLMIEVKTSVVDVQDLVGTVGRKRRLAAAIVRERGWRPARVATWVVLADSRTNRRRLAQHRHTLRAAFPADGFAVERWLREPSGDLHALSFLTLQGCQRSLT